MGSKIRLDSESFEQFDDAALLGELEAFSKDAATLSVAVFNLIKEQAGVIIEALEDAQIIDKLVHACKALAEFGLESFKVIGAHLAQAAQAVGKLISEIPWNELGIMNRSILLTSLALTEMINDSLAAAANESIDSIALLTTDLTKSTLFCASGSLDTFFRDGRLRRPHDVGILAGRINFRCPGEDSLFFGHTGESLRWP